MNVSVYMKGDYEEFYALEAAKNKAKQTQLLFFTAENAECAEQKRICVSDCPIKKYNKLLLGDLRALGG